MNLTNLLNGSMQTLATGLIVFGSMAVKDTKDYVGGGMIIVAGLIVYVLYEIFPANKQN